MKSSESIYDSSQSRRDFMRQLGLAGASYTLLKSLYACSSDASQSIRFYGTPTLDIKNWDQLKKDLDLEIAFESNGNDTGPVVANMLNGTAAFDFDLGGVQGGIEKELALANKILPWDLSKIPNWQDTWSWIKDLPHCKVNGKQYGLPTVINADSVIYLPEKIGGKVDSYEVIFDPKFKGRTSMEDAWINSVIFTAIYLKENSIYKIDKPGDLTESELGTVMEFLIKKKREKQFKTFWKRWEGAEKLLASGEVYAMTGWEPIVNSLQKKGVKVEYAETREGYEGWTNDLIIHIGAEKRGLVDDIHKFANWELAGYYGCEIFKQWHYSVPNNNSIKYASIHPKDYNVDEQRAQVENITDRFKKEKGLVHWQNTRPKNYKLYEEWWSKLRNT